MPPRIADVREVTKPISSPIRNAWIDIGRMTVSLVAVVTNVTRWQDHGRLWFHLQRPLRPGGSGSGSRGRRLFFRSCRTWRIEGFPPDAKPSLPVLLRQPAEDNRKVLPAVTCVYHLPIEAERLRPQRRGRTRCFRRRLRQFEVLHHQGSGKPGRVIAVGGRG